MPITALVLLLGLVGCADGGDRSGATSARNSDGSSDAAGAAGEQATVSLGERDVDALAQLAGIAARDAQPEGVLGTTACWAPSQNPLEADDASATGAFRVLCRVHYEQRGEDRYRDMICLGDLGQDPVAEYCYPWAYYTDMPRFEDRPAYDAPAAPSLPR